MRIERIDHLVLTVADIAKTAQFYTDVLGMRTVTFGEGRVALVFGNQKINLHQSGEEFEPKAKHPTPGSGDLCFVTDTPLESVVKHLDAKSVKIEEGPVKRTGAQGAVMSVYIRDLDGNLVEISNYI